MIDEKKLKQVYGTLQQGGYSEDYNTFKSGFTGNKNYSNRKQVYDLLSTHGASIGDSYEEFMQLMQKPKAGNTPMTDEDRARFSAGAQAISSSAQQTVNNAGRYNNLQQRKKKQQQNFGRVNIGSDRTPFSKENNVVKDDFAYNPETGETGTYVTSDNDDTYTISDAQQKQAALDEYGRSYQQAVDSGELPSILDVRDKDGNYDLQENIGKDGTYLTEEGAQAQLDRKLQDAYARKKEIEDAIAEDNRKNGNPLLAYSGAIGAGNGRDAESSDYRNKLATSLALVDEEINSLEAVNGVAGEDHAYMKAAKWLGNKINDVTLGLAGGTADLVALGINFAFGENTTRDMSKALKNTAFNAKTWDFGITDFAVMGQMERVKAKMDNGIPLTDSEKMLLNSKLGADAAAALEDKEMGNAYRWTKIAGQSLPFMADFFLTGGYGGITKGLGKAGIEYAAKLGMGKLGKNMLKYTGVTVGNVIGSYAMAGTTQALKTGADIVQRHMGNLYQDENGDYAFGTFDENGNLLHEGGESMGTALYKGLTSAMVENYTEKFFHHTHFKRFLGKKMAGTKLGDWLSKVGTKGWYANSKSIMKKFGIDGFGEEVMEEEIGIPLHALLDGEGEVSDLLDARQQMDIIGGMALSVGGMAFVTGGGKAAVKNGYHRAQYYRYKHKVDVSDSEAQQLFGDDWGDLKDNIDNATNEKMGGVLVNIFRNKDLTKEQRDAAVEYGVNLMKMRGYNLASTMQLDARRITGETNTDQENHDQEIEDSYSEGHNAEGEQTHTIQLEQNASATALASLLGISENQLHDMSDEELEAKTGQDDKLDKAIYDYQMSTARYNGVMDNANDKVDMAAQQAALLVDQTTDLSRGTVRNATIKATQGAEDYGVYIISGNLATHEDGTIDISGSDQMILYYDPTTGRKEYADPSRFSSLGEEHAADEVKTQAVADAKEKVIREIAGIIDGRVDVGSSFVVTDEQGNQHTYEVLADNGDGTAMITLDGNVPTQLVDGETVQMPVSFDELQQMKDAEDERVMNEARQKRAELEAQREQQKQEEEQQQVQNEEQLQAQYNNLVDDEGNVVMCNVRDAQHDGQPAFIVGINQSNKKPYVVFLNEDGSFTKPRTYKNEMVARGESIDFETFKAMMPTAAVEEETPIENEASSAVEDNSGETTIAPVEEETLEEEQGTENTQQIAEQENTEQQQPAAPAVEPQKFEDGTDVPLSDDGEVDFSQTDAAHAAEWYDNNLGEDADGVLDDYVRQAKNALGKAQNRKITGSKPSELVASRKEKEAAIKEAKAALDSATAIRDAYNDRLLSKEEGTAEGRRNLVEKARRKYNRLKGALKDDAEGLSKLYKETVGAVLHRLYDGTGIDVMDEAPLTAEEYVASSLAKNSLNYEGNEKSKGVKQETGLSRADFAKTQLLAADGKGTTIDDMVDRLWNDRPSNLDNLDTQDIRSALLDVITSGYKASEARNYVQNLRIAQAENMLDEQKRAADNAAFEEEQRRAAEEEQRSATDSEEEGQTEVPEDSTDEKPLGEQKQESELPFQKKKEIDQETSESEHKARTYEELMADAEKNSVGGLQVVDNIIGKKTRKALDRIAKMMGAKIQYLYTDIDNNGWYDEKTNTIYLTLDSSITEGVQFVFGHEMTHEMKTKNPEAFEELKQLVKDMMGEDAFDAQTDAMQKRYKRGGAKYWNNRNAIEEEVVADQLGSWLQDLNYAHTLSLKMSHPLLAKLHEIINRIRMAFYGTEYTDKAKMIMRSIEQAYIQTANHEAANTAAHEGESGNRFSVRTKPAPKKTQKVYKLMRLGEDGKLYPLFIGNAEAVELGVWYDGDSPKLQDLKSLSSKEYVGTRTVSRGGKKVKEEYNYGSYLVSNETGEATSLADFKAKHKGEKAFSRMGNNPNVAALNWATDNGYRWIKIEEKNQGQGRYGGENRSYYNYGINGTGAVAIFAMRPGWHAGSLPTMRQIGKGKESNLRDDTFVWTEGEVSADIDYNEEAQANADKDIPDHTPTDGYYLKATNANKEASQADKVGWYVAGAFKPNRIMSDKETRDIIDQWNAAHPNEEKVEYDWKRESGKEFNAETMRLEDTPKFSLRVYHGSGADFSEFDFDHMGEGEGSQAFGWGGYVTSSKKIGKFYATNMDNDSSNHQHLTKSNADRILKKYPTLESFLSDPKVDSKVKHTEEEKVAYYNNVLKDAEPYHNLYEVNIPDDTGSNYLDWDRPLTDEQQETIYQALYELPQEQLDKMAEGDASFRNTLYNIIKNVDKERAIPALVSDNTLTKQTIMDEFDVPNTGATAYRRLVDWLDSQKDASQLLAKAGFTGIKYEAGRNFDGAEEGDTNYVIFKPEDMQIAEHTKFSLKQEKDRIVADAKANGTYMLAPNGKKTNLDKEQWATVRTNNFKKWFGDWENDPENASKVVDGNGEPMVVYHGRSADFNTFEKKEGVRFVMGLEDKVKSEGFFFSPDKTLADEFAGNAARHRGGKANIVPCFLNIRKPMDLTGEDYDRIYEDVTGWEYTVGMDTQDNLWGIMDEEGMADKMKAKGYDGAIFAEELDDSYEPSKISYCALDANQIKSADNNNGDFSADNNDIRYSLKDSQRISPEIANTPVNIVDADAKHGFKNYAEAREWAKKNIVRFYSNEETGGKGEINISNTAIGKYLSEKAVKKSANKDVHMSVLKVLPSVLRESVDAIQHGDRKKIGENRSEENGINPDVMMHRCYGAVNIGGKTYGVKITLKKNVKTKEKTKLYSYEATKIELLDGQSEGVTMTPSRNSNNSITVAKILKGFETAKENAEKLDSEGQKFSLKDEKTMFGMHNITLDKLRKAIKQGGFAAPSMGVIDSKNGIYSDYGEITLIPKSEKLAKSKGKNAGTFLGDGWTPIYPQVEKIMNKQGEKAFNADMNENLGKLDNNIYSNVRESWKGYFDHGNTRDGLYWHYLFEKELNPEIIYQKGKYDKDLIDTVKSIAMDGRFMKNEYTADEISKLISLYSKETGEDMSTTGELERLEKQKNDAKSSLQKGFYQKRIDSVIADGEEHDFFVARKFADRVLDDAFKSGKVKILDTMEAAKQKVEEDKKLSADFSSWLNDKSEQYGVEEMLYTGTTPTGKPKYIPNTVENAVKLMKKKDLAGGYGMFGGIGSFIAKHSDTVTTLKQMKAAKGKLISKADAEKRDKMREEINREFRYLSNQIDVPGGYSFDAGDARMMELADHKGHEKEYIKKEYKMDVSDDWVERYNKLINTIKNEYPVFYFETKFMRPYGLDEFEKAIVPKDTPSDVVDALEKAGIDVHTYENEADREKVTMDAINSSADIRFSLKQTNDRFNDELEEFKNKTHRGLMHLGQPSPILKACGVNVDEITLSPKVLNRKLNQHSLAADDVKDLVNAIQKPILVYKHGLKDPNLVIVTDAELRGNKMSIALELDAEGNVVNLSNVSSIHDKDADKEVERLLDFTPEEFREALRWCEKEKVLDWLSPARLFSHMQTENSQGLSHAKVLKDFENPSISSKNLHDEPKFSLRSDQYQHSLAQWKRDNGLPKDAEMPSLPMRNPGESAVDFAGRIKEYRRQMALWKTAPQYEQHLLTDDTAQGQFNTELQRSSVLARIALQDSMLAVRKAQEAIMSEVGVGKLNIAEDAYTAENRSHGKGKNEFEQYNDEYLQPLRRAYHRLMKKLGNSYDKVKIYMVAKHALERNAHMAFRDALDSDYEDASQRSAAYKAYMADQARVFNDADFIGGKIDFPTWKQADNAIRSKYAPSYMKYRYDSMGITQDYAGLSALFDGADFEEAAAEMVRDVERENPVETDVLWGDVNAATKKILRDSYKAGMMSKEAYEYVRGMYRNYIPLRGWSDTNADQVWNYMGGGKGAFNQTLKKANGRGSLADDPIAYIENMAESGILINNKNWVKQHLMLLAENHPTSLLNLSKAWYVKTKDAQGNEQWIPASPQITEGMTSQQVKNALEAFEQKMEQMRQKGDATQKREHLEITYPQTKGEEREHEVRVMKDGEEYVIYVNGDPQLAQAMNNTRAHRVREGLENSISQKLLARLGRWMASVYTSLSPLFIPSNFFRDTTMTLASTAIREDARYNYLLRKNMLSHWNILSLVNRYQNGTLRSRVENGTADKNEQLFYDFMMNGGETGFVSSLDVEDLKKKFKNELEDMNRMAVNPKKVGHAVMDIIETLNRAIEDSNRFAVYRTSIEYGRSIGEAVNDAKDVTLNFNRKGTGEHGWQTIRNLYLFINPAIQSLQTLGALAKHHPFKFTAVTAAWLASGVLTPLVNNLLMDMFGGDDDKDKYWSFTKWDRRNNFILWVPFTHNFVKIPLAQEFRGFYGVGDMIASKFWGGEKAQQSWEDYGMDMLGQVVDMLPLDPTGYDGNVAVSLMPNPVRPIFELAFNVDFTGKPLFKDSEYNKYDPNFTKAYAGTPDWLVRISKMVNSVGNDYPDVQQNAIDKFGDPRYNLNNPAVVDHVLSSYLGGAYTMGSQVLGLLTKALNDPDNIKMADIPLASKFVGNPDDRPVSKKQGDNFWITKERHDRAANTLSKLKKKAKVDGDYSTLDVFFGSDEYKQYKLDDKEVKKYQEDKKKEQAEEMGLEYNEKKLTSNEVYQQHSTPKDDYEDMLVSQIYPKVRDIKLKWESKLDAMSSDADSYYNANADAINAASEVENIRKDIAEKKKGFLTDDKDTYSAEDMGEIRRLRKEALTLLLKANKLIVEKQKAKAEK